MNENIRIEKMKSMRTAYFHAFSDTPEDDAWKKAEAWAKGKGLLTKDSKTRIFGRNTYPTTKPKPYGYGYYITITPDIKIEKEIYVRIIPGGLYAISRCEGIEELSKKWGEMWKWVKESKHKYIGETKGEFGFELGFEEHLNWYPTLVDKSENKFIFNIMLQLWEE